LVPTAIVRPPSETFADGLTVSGLGPPDLRLALAQHQAYCTALAQCGAALVSLKPEPAYPDSTFVEDTAVIVYGTAILARPGASSRRGEADLIRDTLRTRFADLKTIEAPGTLDGGDVCHAGDIVFVGLSDRTNEEGIRQLTEYLNGVDVRMIDIRGRDGLLHLKSGMSWLGGQRLLISEELSDVMVGSGYDVLKTDPRESYAANCVVLNRTVLLPAGYPRTESMLKSLGFSTLVLDMSEFRKMDGGLSCLSVRVPGL